MSAYNKINGVYCSESPVLLDSILRNNWGFSGLVMTDWFAGRDRIRQVEAGIDLQMPGSKFIATQIIDAVNKGKLNESFVDRNVNHILNLIQKTPRFKGYKYSNNPDLKANARVAEQVAADGMVLLKNKLKTLPLKKSIRKIAVFGIGSFETISRGTGSGNVNCAYTVSIEQGLKNREYEVSETFKKTYVEHIEKEIERVGKKKSYFDPDIILDEKVWADTELKQFVTDCDLALLTISRSSGEFADRSVINDFLLTEKEQQMIDKLSKSIHSRGQKLVVVLNIGGVIETASWKDKANAILLAWQPGQEAGNAVAQILSGDVTPSGKLTMTFPFVYADVPSALYFPDKSLNPNIVNYDEGQLVGYRHYSANGIIPSFEFGFGLSYTKFKYDNLKISNIKDCKYDIQFKVTNTGTTKGKEVVQLYLKSKDSKMIQLKHFSKTPLLNPGKSVTLQFQITSADLAVYDNEKTAWKFENGEHILLIGASSRDIRLQSSISFTN